MLSRLACPLGARSGRLIPGELEQGVERIAVDETGLSRTFYRIDATPTVLLIDSDTKIHWATMGISPTLEYRIGSFLSQ